jgi:exodeoxyribonuclease VII small subunit
MAAKFSYEKAIAQIEAIIEDIENEDLNVDELSEKVKEVSILLKNCKKKLVDTKGEVDQLLIDMEKE